jgi:hypothetical protein
VSLLNHNYGADTALDPIAFEVPEGTTQTRLEYRTTGHGGADDDSPTCIGPAEEFCRRTHTLWIDEEPRPGFIPWRDDCADLCTLTHYGPANAGFDYCLENPTGSIQSVQAPRANWCPGSETPPFVYDLDLAPGPHSFRYAVRAVKPGGSWRTSATAYFYGD